MKSRFVRLAGLATALVGVGAWLSLHAQAQPPTTAGGGPAPSGANSTPQIQPRGLSPAEAALASAAQQQKYLFLVFWKEDTSETRTVGGALQAALARHSGRAASVWVRITDPTEKAIVDRFSVSRSPMPLVLAIAPNGAVTGGFPLKLSEQDVAGAFVSAATAACLKATQTRKLVLLCVQPAGTQDLPAWVRAFQADAQYGPATEVVTLRADDAAEAGLLKALQVTPAPTTVTAFLAPPGRLLGTFDASVTREQLIDKLRAAGNSCCPGGKCGPGGCCPGGKCGPNQ